MKLPQELTVLSDTHDPCIRALRSLDQVQDLEVRKARDRHEPGISNLEPLQVDFNQAVLSTSNIFQNFVPVAQATQQLQGLQVLRSHDQGAEARPVVELLEAYGPERGRGEAGADGGFDGVVDAAEALDGELLEGGAVVEDGVHALDSERARSAGEFFEVLAVPGEGGHAGVGELAARAELEAREVLAAEGDEGKGVVVEADGSAVAAEGELGDGVEAGEEGGDLHEEVGLGVEGQAVAALALDFEPALGDEGGVLAVAGAEEVEDGGEALVGYLGDVVVYGSDVTALVVVRVRHGVVVSLGSGRDGAVVVVVGGVGGTWAVG